MKTIFAFTFALLLVGIVGYSQTEITINNKKARLDTEGKIVELHAGGIIKFENKYYWYGENYALTSGYQRNNYFQCYSSSDLMNWTKEGVLLNEKPSGTYYRPHIIYNKKTKKFVLWYNWYPKLWDGKYGVAISDKPTGPYKIINTDVKVLHSNMGVGDYGLFIDEDNTAYIAYNTIDGHKGSIEKLSNDYLSSTMENGGFITEGCEAGAIFKRGKKYYMLTDYTCCFCTQGSGVRVYISDYPMKGYEFRNNINRYPGTPSPVLMDKNKSPNVYATIKEQKDSTFSPIQINLSGKKHINAIKIYQFTGNRQGVCGDTLVKKVHDEIRVLEYEVFVKQNNEWIKLNTHPTIEPTSLFNIVTISFEDIASASILIKPISAYPYDEAYINEIEVYWEGKKIDEALAFINNVNPLTALPIIPAQQTFIMPLKSAGGMQFIWMGDLWGSASDNIKDHDYQYWGAPLIFDENGDIEAMDWVDEWKATIMEK